MWKLTILSRVTLNSLVPGRLKAIRHIFPDRAVTWDRADDFGNR